MHFTLAERNVSDHTFRDQVMDNSSAGLSCTLTHLRVGLTSIEQISSIKNKKVLHLKNLPVLICKEVRIHVLNGLTKRQTDILQKEHIHQC